MNGRCSVAGIPVLQRMLTDSLSQTGHLLTEEILELGRMAITTLLKAFQPLNIPLLLAAPEMIYLFFYYFVDVFLTCANIFLALPRLTSSMFALYFTFK